VIASSHSTLHDSDAHHDFEDHDPDIEPPTSRSEPVSPGEAQRRQILTLAPSPSGLTMLAGGTAAVLFGGAVGFWLGRRSAPRPVHRAAVNLESAVALAPVAMKLLSNPMIRALAIRLIVRQFSKRIAH
jgi:hypothetical protein